MKKHLIAVLLVVVICVATLAGCSGLKSLERYVTLVLKVDDEIYATYEISNFNNAVVTAPKVQGMSLYGWTPEKDWENKELGELAVTSNKTYITYGDVKDYIDGDSMSVTLYAVFAVIPRHDLCIAWYRAEGVSTDTGLNEDIMDTFEADMYTFLESKGQSPAELDIVVRPYDKNVGTSTSLILDDGDVDLALGWGSNFTDYIATLEHNGAVSVGSVARYASRLSDTYLVRLVYWWMLTTYGGDRYAALPEPTPDAEPAPTPSYDNEIKIAWYAKTETSGLDEANMAIFESTLRSFLVSRGYKNDKTNILLNGYDGDVAPSWQALQDDGYADIALGWGSNLTTNTTLALIKGEDYFSHDSGIYISPGKSRYATLLSDDELSTLIYQWILITYGGKEWGGSEPEEPGEYVPVTDPAVVALLSESSLDKTEAYKLVIGWYGKEDTSGLNETIMDNFKKAVEANLRSAGFTNVTIEIKICGTGNVASAVTAIEGYAADGIIVDMMLGLGNSHSGITYKDGYRQTGLTMGGKGSRNVLIREECSENLEFAIAVYNWLVGTESNGWLSSADAKTVDIHA